MDSITLVVTILSALLASAVLMIFIENQHIAANVNARYQMVMTPFLHKLSNYFKYIFDVSHAIDIINDNIGITDFVNLLKKFDKYSYMTVMSGRNYPICYFSAAQIDEICSDINKVWQMHKEYQIEGNGSYKLNRLLDYELTNSYLIEIFTDKKFDDSSLKQLAEVSGEFYYEIYLPIKDYTPQYEVWQKKDRIFKLVTCGNIVVSVVFLIITLFFGDCICDYAIKSFAAISLILIAVSIFMMIKNEKFSNEMFL